MRVAVSSIPAIGLYLQGASSRLGGSDMGLAERSKRVEPFAARDSGWLAKNRIESRSRLPPKRLTLPDPTTTDAQEDDRPAEQGDRAAGIGNIRSRSESTPNREVRLPVRDGSV